MWETGSWIIDTSLNTCTFAHLLTSPHFSTYLKIFSTLPLDLHTYPYLTIFNSTILQCSTDLLI